MRISQPRASFLVAGTLAVTALVTVACGGGSSIPQPPGAGAPVGSDPTGQYSTYALSPAGGTYQLKLPSGYSGAITVGPNAAPIGATMQVGVIGAFPAAGEIAPLTRTQPDPFPISINIRFPFTITIPIEGFSITFPPWCHLAQRTFTAAIYDPSHQVDFLGPDFNPLTLGTATVHGQTLTFVPVVKSFTFMANVTYSLTIADTTGGGGSSVIPFSAAPDQTAGGSNGPLGVALLTFQPNSSGLGQSAYVLGGPVLTFQQTPTDATPAQGTVSLIFQSSKNASISNGSVTITTNPSSTSSPMPGTGNFTPSGPPLLIPATVTGPNQVHFNIPSSFVVGPGQKVALSVYSVTVCVPSLIGTPCDYNHPNYALTDLDAGRQYDVYISDALSVLKGSYSVKLIGTDVNGNPLPAGAYACSFAPESGGNGDVPPGYSDALTTSALDAYGGHPVGPGPNTEFEINTGSPGSLSSTICEMQVSQNGNVVVDDNWTIMSQSPELRGRGIRPLLSKPPVNGVNGSLSGGN
jgi:hypothetical protein